MHTQSLSAEKNVAERLAQSSVSFFERRERKLSKVILKS